MDTACMPGKKYPTSDVNCSLTSGLFMANLPGLKECEIAYNATYMALLWDVVATKMDFFILLHK